MDLSREKHLSHCGRVAARTSHWKPADGKSHRLSFRTVSLSQAPQGFCCWGHDPVRVWMVYCSSLLWKAQQHLLSFGYLNKTSVLGGINMVSNVLGKLQERRTRGEEQGDKWVTPDSSPTWEFYCSHTNYCRICMLTVGQWCYESLNFKDLQRYAKVQKRKNSQDFLVWFYREMVTLRKN